MIVIDALLAGTLITASLRIFQRRRRRNLMYWLSLPADTPFDGDYENTQALNTLNQRVRVSYRLATYSLGLSLIGALIYTPLGIISTPLTLVSALPLFERTIDNALERARLNGDVISATALIVTILSEGYLLASALQWLLALNELVAFRLSRRLRTYFDPNAMPNVGQLQDLMAALRYEQWRRNADLITLDPRFVTNTGKSAN
ncbi:MAG: hypothetical protein GYB67_07040 [Chloroflexi bacterium]|nr:hypothetical protein [Chloroflexota bacterium]